MFNISSNKLARVINKPKPSQNPDRRLGSVPLTYNRSDPKIPVTFDGETTEHMLLGTVEVMPGDRVTLDRYGKQWLVTGVIRDFDWFFMGNLGFGTGWQNYGSGWESVKARRDPGGTVHLEGMIRTTIATNTNTMFTLPTGYRPAYNRIHPVASGSAVNYRRILIAPTGAVSLYVDTNTAANDWISFTGVSFLSDTL